MQGDVMNRRSLRSGLALAVATLLAGCTLFQSEAPEQAADTLGEIPADWAVPDGVAPFGSGWIEDFQDPQLPALVDEVWRNNASLLGAIHRRDAAEARTQLDKAASIPRVDFQAQAGRQRQINDFLGNSVVIPEETYISRLKLGLGINWEMDLWGRALNSTNAAVGDVWAAGLDVQAAQFSLAGQTASLWFSLIAAEQRLKISEQLVANHGRNVEFSQERYQRGLITSAELRQALSEQAAAQAEKVTREIDRARSARALEVLLGRYPSANLQGQPQLPPLPAPLDAGVPSQMLERRPDVQAVALRLMASDQRLLAAKKNLLPRFSIQASGATQDKYRDLLFTEDSFVWSIGGGLLQPLFDGGQIRAGIRAQRALMFEAIFRYREKVYGAYREVEDALAADAGLRTQRSYLQTATELAEQSATAATERLSSGSIDGRMVLAAQRGVLTAQSRLLELDLAALNNRVALALALGGSPVTPPEETPEETPAETSEDMPTGAAPPAEPAVPTESPS